MTSYHSPLALAPLFSSYPPAKPALSNNNYITAINPASHIGSFSSTIATNSASLHPQPVASSSSPRSAESPTIAEDEKPPQKKVRGRGRPKEEKRKEKEIPVKVPSKRGRKKKEDTVSEEYEEVDSNGRRGSQDPGEVKRKVQNRAAQRAFRERKEHHVKDLEDRVEAQDSELAAYRVLVQQLARENAALRRGEVVAPTSIELPRSFTSKFDTKPSLKTVKSEEEAEEALLGLSVTPESTFTAENTESFTSSSFSNHNIDTGFDLQNLNQPSLPQGTSTITQSAIPETEPKLVELNFDDFQFDFDTPFDFSTAVPFPPSFQTLLSDFTQSASSSSVPSPLSSTAITLDMEVDEDEEDPESSLPEGEGGVKRLPCDKPECDFTTVSCALPSPWRPPTLKDELKSKDVWMCKQAWGKLCSHPLFSLCDIDELCHELRDMTRCSDDGRLVVAKSDVCELFTTIPARAKAKQEQVNMG